MKGWGFDFCFLRFINSEIQSPYLKPKELYQIKKWQIIPLWRKTLPFTFKLLPYLFKSKQTALILGLIIFTLLRVYKRKYTQMTNVILITFCFWVKQCAHSHTWTLRNQQQLYYPPAVWAQQWDASCLQQHLRRSQYWPVGEIQEKNPTKISPTIFFYRKTIISKYKTMWKGRKHSPTKVEKNQNLQGVCGRSTLEELSKRDAFSLGLGELDKPRKRAECPRAEGAAGAKHSRPWAGTERYAGYLKSCLPRQFCLRTGLTWWRVGRTIEQGMAVSFLAQRNAL